MDEHLNVSIYIDVWCSMNGRFTQRMFDSKADLLKVSWSPFKPVSFLMPLLDEAIGWRAVLNDIKKEVHSWSNSSHVLFVADFPGKSHVSITLCPTAGLGSALKIEDFVNIPQSRLVDEG